jgi:hypothetical protein
LDETAEALLDTQWALDRQRLAPEAVKLSHNKHVGISYAMRRAREWADVPAKPGEYRGGPVQWLRVVRDE